MVCTIEVYRVLSLNVMDELLATLKSKEILPLTLKESGYHTISLGPEFNGAMPVYVS